jgi:hypothetical protein
MSQFINRSKDPRGTAAVEAHFGGSNQGQRPGTDSLLKSSPYGTQAWNNPSGDVSFNAPGQNLPAGTGVNYNPQPGHSASQDPFSLADGFPGN